MVALAESLEIGAALTTNSLTALKRVVESGNFVALIGQFAAYRELASGHLSVVEVDRYSKALRLGFFKSGTADVDTHER